MRLLAYGLLSVAFLFLGWFVASYKTEISQKTDGVAEFAGVSLRIDYATTTASRERGLGGRQSIPEDYGMLFIFPEDGKYGFWMKDTLLPLDIFWFDAEGNLVFTARDVATSTFPHVFEPTVPARYVLETNAGFARLYDVATGTPIKLHF